MKKWFCFLVVSACSANCISQPAGNEIVTATRGKNNSFSIGIVAPIGDFSKTHSLAVSAEYVWCHNRFGSLSPQPIKQLDFTFNTGIDYYFGKKENTGYTPYTYDKYIFLHLYGGLIYNPGEKLNFTLTAGPAIGIYNDDTQFNMGINLNGSYYLTKRIAITPAIMLMKESKSNPLIAIALRGSFCF
jgi:hypothetical protein